MSRAEAEAGLDAVDLVARPEGTLEDPAHERGVPVPHDWRRAWVPLGGRAGERHIVRTHARARAPRVAGRRTCAAADQDSRRSRLRHGGARGIERGAR